MRITKMKTLLFAFIVSLLLFSCGNTELTKLKEETKKIADDMTTIFKEGKEALTTLDKTIEDAYSIPSYDNIDTSGMDEAEGGRFYFFQEKMYVSKYSQDRPDECANVFFGALEFTEEIKRKMKIQMSIEDDMTAMGKSSPYYGRIVFFTDWNTALSYPALDVPSVFPVGLDISAFDWYQSFKSLGDTVGLGSPTVALGPEGWIQSSATGVTVNGKAIGEVHFDILIFQLAKDLLKDSESSMLILHKSSTVMNVTDAANEILKINAIKAFDYIEQLKNNPEISAEVILNNENQRDDIKNFAKAILEGAGERTVVIDGKEYTIIVEFVSEADYYIVGLL